MHSELTASEMAYAIKVLNSNEWPGDYARIFIPSGLSPSPDKKLVGGICKENAKVICFKREKVDNKWYLDVQSS